MPEFARYWRSRRKRLVVSQEGGGGKRGKSTSLGRVTRRAPGMWILLAVTVTAEAVADQIGLQPTAACHSAYVRSTALSPGGSSLGLPYALQSVPIRGINNTCPVEPTTRTLSRQELYDLVWSEPMAQLGKRLGISEVDLSKVCDRMRIPAPGRGWWAKKEAGHAVKRDRLPPLPDGAAQSMRQVTFAEGHGGQAVAGSERVAAQHAVEGMPENRIVVAEILENPHPLVAQTVRTFRGAKREPRKGFLAPKEPSKALAIFTSLESVDRAIRIMDSLVKALEHRGFPVGISPTSQQESPSLFATAVEIDGTSVHFCIKEKINRVNAPAGSGEFYRYESTGKLSLQLGNYSSYSWHRSWNDGARQRVEECLNAFIVSAVDRAEVVRREEAERAERERLRNLEEQRRAEVAKRERIEAERAKRLKEIIADQRLAVDIRTYVAAQRAVLDSLKDEKHRPIIEEWLSWAAEYAETIDPICTYAVPMITDPGNHPWQRGKDGY
jgi:hypothetical protein